MVGAATTGQRVLGHPAEPLCGSFRRRARVPSEAVAIAAPAGGSLELANATRIGTASASPYELWKLAEYETDGPAGRRENYRHAMIHAGHLRTAKGRRYKRCPICRGALNG